jgi:hypothetical protein
MTADALSTFLSQTCNATPMTFDSEYALPARDWFLNQFGPATHDAMQKLGVAGYETEAWDCEDFAFFAANWAKMCHRRTAGHPAKGLAVGVFVYYPATSSGGLHAINVAVVRRDPLALDPALAPDPSAYELVFLEPQSGQEKKLSADELSSCMAIII